MDEDSRIIDIRQPRQQCSHHGARRDAVCIGRAQICQGTGQVFEAGGMIRSQGRIEGHEALLYSAALTVSPVDRSSMGGFGAAARSSRV